MVPGKLRREINRESDRELIRKLRKRECVCERERERDREKERDRGQAKKRDREKERYGELIRDLRKRGR